MYQVIFCSAQNSTILPCQPICQPITPNHSLTLQKSYPQGSALSYSNIVLFSRVCLDFQSGLFHSGFQTKILYAFLNILMHAACPHILSDLIIRIIVKIRNCRTPVYTFFPRMLSFHPSYIQSIILPVVLNLCSSHNMRDQVSRPYETTGKTIVLYTLLFMFLDSRWEHQRY